MSTLGEHRSHPRHLSGITVEFRNQTRTRSAQLFDVAESGVFIRCLAPPTVGSEFSLAFHLPNDPEPVRARGRVVWSQSQDTEHHPAGMGVHLAEMDEEGRTRFLAYLHALA